MGIERMEFEKGVCGFCHGCGEMERRKGKGTVTP